VRLSRSGIIELAEHADALLHLSLAEIPQFCGALPAALASGCTSLRSLDLSGCVRIDEHNVRTLVTSMTRVTELKLNRCRLIERQFLKNLADELPFVQNATEFYGLVGLPDCDARIYLAELRRAQLKAVAPLQRLARGMLARMRTRRLRLARQRENAAFMIQRVWRGFLDRRRVRQLVKGLTLEEAAIMIQSCERGWIGRLKVRRLKWRLLMAARRSRAATTVQATWRRYLARCLYGRLLDQKFLREHHRNVMEDLSRALSCDGHQGGAAPRAGVATTAAPGSDGHSAHHARQTCPHADGQDAGVLGVDDSSGQSMPARANGGAPLHLAPRSRPPTTRARDPHAVEGSVQDSGGVSRLAWASYLRHHPES
jgi:hypothetical protein